MTRSQGGRQTRRNAPHDHRPRPLLLGLTLAALAGCGAPPAGASAQALLPGARYLFDLRDDEIAGAHAHYAPRTSLPELRRWLTPPLSCARFGDLCDKVGPARAEQVLASLWQNARAGRMTRAELDQALEADLARHAAARFAERFPLGAPGGDPYFGRLGGGNAPLCGPPSYAEDGDARGRWERAAAPHLEARGDVVVAPAGGTPQSFFTQEVKTSASRATATFTYVGTGSVSFVEGCGGTAENGALWTCACAGSFPGEDGGGGGDGGGGRRPARGRAVAPPLR